MINKIYIYCPVVTEKSSNRSVKLTLSLPRIAKACRGMDKLIWHEG